MMGRDSKQDIETYGLWPWVAGVLLSAGLIWFMFLFAVPIS